MGIETTPLAFQASVVTVTLPRLYEAITLSTPTCLCDFQFERSLQIIQKHLSEKPCEGLHDTDATEEMVLETIDSNESQVDRYSAAPQTCPS